MSPCASAPSVSGAAGASGVPSVGEVGLQNGVSSTMNPRPPFASRGSRRTVSGMGSSPSAALAFQPAGTAMSSAPCPGTSKRCRCGAGAVPPRRPAQAPKSSGTARARASGARSARRGVVMFPPPSVPRGLRSAPAWSLRSFLPFPNYCRPYSASGGSARATPCGRPAWSAPRRLAGASPRGHDARREADRRRRAAQSRDDRLGTPAGPAARRQGARARQRHRRARRLPRARVPGARVAAVGSGPGGARQHPRLVRGGASSEPARAARLRRPAPALAGADPPMPCSA